MSDPRSKWTASVYRFEHGGYLAVVEREQGRDDWCWSTYRQDTYEGQRYWSSVLSAYEQTLEAAQAKAEWALLAHVERSKVRP